MRYLSILLFSTLLFACTTTSGGSSPKNVSNDVTRDDLNETDRLNYQLGEDYVRRGEYQIAEEKLLALTHKYPNFTELYVLMGISRERQGKKTDAVSYYSKAIATNPLDRQALKNYARLLCDQYDNTSAQKMAGIADSAMSELKAGMNSGAAGCFLVHGNYAKANEYADRAIAANPQYPDSYYFKAIALNGLKRYSEVFPVLDRYHDQSGYDAGSLATGLEAARKSNNSEQIAKYENIMARR